MKKLILTIINNLIEAERFAGLNDRYRKNREEIHRMVRYLAVGGWNTLFGLGVYSLLYALFKNSVNYLALTIPTNILAITNAYLCYKLLVFRTKGNWWREYWRCYVVYGGGALLGMAMLFLLVSGCGFHPVAAQVLTVAMTIAGSYVGHKYFSFGRKKKSNDSGNNDIP